MPVVGGVGVRVPEQLAVGVPADRLQHPERGRRPPAIRAQHERPGLQRGEQVRRYAVQPGQDVRRGVGVERTGEHRKPPERGLFAWREQVVAPRHGGPQAAVARRGGTGTSGQQGEPVVQPGHDRVRWQQPYRAGGQFQRQRQPVQPAAQGRHRGGVGFGQGEAGCGLPSPFDEQRHRLAPQEVRYRSAVRRQAQRRYRVPHLAGDPEGLAAGGEHADAGGVPRQGRYRLGAVAEQVLAGVEDQQRGAAGERCGDRLPARCAPGRGDGQHGRDGRRYPAGLVQRHQVHPVRIPAADAVRQLDGQPGLAGTGRPDQRDQPGLAQQRRQFGEFPAAPDEPVDALGERVGGGGTLSAPVRALAARVGAVPRHVPRHLPGRQRGVACLAGRSLLGHVAPGYAAGDETPRMWTVDARPPTCTGSPCRNAADFADARRQVNRDAGCPFAG